MTSKRQEECKMRRGKVALGAPACGFPRRWKSIGEGFSDSVLPSNTGFRHRVAWAEVRRSGVGLDGHIEEKLKGRGSGCSGVRCRRTMCSRLWLQRDTGLKKGSYHGPHTGRLCWPLLFELWKAIAPLMKPWCAEGEVPTAANLNLYGQGTAQR